MGEAGICHSLRMPSGEPASCFRAGRERAEFYFSVYLPVVVELIVCLALSLDPPAFSLT